MEEIPEDNDDYIPEETTSEHLEEVFDIADDQLCSKTVYPLVDKTSMTDVTECVNTIRDLRCDLFGGYFVLSSYSEMIQLIKNYSQNTSSHFVVSKKTKYFGMPSLECDLSGHQIQWRDIKSSTTIENFFTPYDGIPHITVGHYVLHCEFGSDTSYTQKEKRRRKKELDGIFTKARTLKCATKKCGCPAKLHVKQILKFPQFQVDKETVRRKRTVAAQLREKLKECRESVESEVYFLGRLPNISEHKFHDFLDGREFAKEPVHKDLVIKTQELYLQNYSTSEILESLRNHVANNMFWKQEPPDPKRRRFYPNRKEIRDFIGRIRHLSKFTQEEEECIKKTVDKIQVDKDGVNILLDIHENVFKKNKPDSSDDEFVEPETAVNSDKRPKMEKKVQTVLFCYQTPKQQRLLKRYGNQAYLVEVKCNTSLKRALTIEMYALLVQTNVDFQVVGSFICSKQRRDGVTEALNVFKEWNTYWQPKYFLVDCSEKIIVAVKTVFQDADYYLTPTSCEKKWMEFINTPSNDVQEFSEDIITFLKNMMSSYTEDSLTVAASALEASSVWKNSINLRTWFQDNWLHSAKKWVFGYRAEDLLVLGHTSSTVYDFIKPYEEALYQSSKPNGFALVIEKVAYSISDEEYKKYVGKNEKLYFLSKEFSEHKLSTSSFHKSNLSCFQGMPLSMPLFVHDISELAQSCDFSITHNQLGLFAVQCTSAPVDQVLDKKQEKKRAKYANIYYNTTPQTNKVTVSFGDLYSYPFCTCSHWQLYKLPCIHMFSIFQRIPEWKYDMFSPIYRSNSSINIDYCFSSSDEAFSVNSRSMEIPKVMVEESTLLSVEQVEVNEILLCQCKDLLQNIDKLAFLFKDRTHHKKLQEDLTSLVNQMQTLVVSEKCDSIDFSQHQIETKALQLRATKNKQPVANSRSDVMPSILSVSSKKGTLSQSATSGKTKTKKIKNINISITDDIPLLVETDTVPRLHTVVASRKRPASFSGNNVSSHSVKNPQRTLSVCSETESKLSMLTYLPKLKNKIVCTGLESLSQQTNHYKPTLETTEDVSYGKEQNITAFHVPVTEDVGCKTNQNVATVVAAETDHNVIEDQRGVSKKMSFYTEDVSLSDPCG